MVTPEKKFNLEATYTFYRQDAGTEKRFNSTEPQIFSSETMGAGFRPVGEQQHPGRARGCRCRASRKGRTAWKSRLRIN